MTHTDINLQKSKNIGHHDRENPTGMFVSLICDSLKDYMIIKRLLFVQKIIFHKHILKSKFLIIILIYKCT